ncbi:MAG: DEAD/DEAH box helicase family protein [Candidatus Coatesbacteria bacterium]|nr:DEAD/DEAH box helicase family protein [Candidatus Coatesbacteria bacterium]
MALFENFPENPYEIIDPSLRWKPDENEIIEQDYATLIPPLVDKIRKGVKEWRRSNYKGATETTKALFKFWFDTEHYLEERVQYTEDIFNKFCFYFAQREAVESVIWLFEIEKAHDPYSLMRYDSSSQISEKMFPEDWTRYVIKMATGTGKTVVMAMLVAWAYYNRKYEESKDLSNNFLVIAPNIIVFERLKSDFKSLQIFHKNPIIPDNGFEGQNWLDDFQLSVHFQDNIGLISNNGNIFLTNIQRVYESRTKEPSIDDENTMDYFLGKKPAGKTTDGKLDVGQIIRRIPDLIVINDEAHHIHDEELEWFKNIEDISNNLRLNDSKLSLQLDFTATPKHTNGSIFVETISDYPLVEAIKQHIVKTPVLPDKASREKLKEKSSDKFTERYKDYLDLGYEEWEKSYNEFNPSGKKPVLFIMTDDTRNCDEVGEFLKTHYPLLSDGVLVIHTKSNGEISEAPSDSSKKKELESLRKLSHEIDNEENKYKAIVSVMMLREGWDVRNVVTMVGLRPYKAKSRILPEQTLGRGLRLMFRGQELKEKVSVIGTSAFIEFVESIEREGVKLEYEPMTIGSKLNNKPFLIEIDTDNKKKNIENLNIKLPVLSSRFYREYKNIANLNINDLPFLNMKLTKFEEKDKREIIFKKLVFEEESHRTELQESYIQNYQNAIGFFVLAITKSMHLVDGKDFLYEKVKQYIETRLFEIPVNIEDRNVLCNLSEVTVTKGIIEAFREALNKLTVEDRGVTELKETISVKNTRPFLSDWKEYIFPMRSIFNRIVGDNNLELKFAAFLDSCNDIISFVKNYMPIGFKIDYRDCEGNISNYYPDFIVQENKDNVWIIETKGLEDTNALLKKERLKEWCREASEFYKDCNFHSLYVKQGKWEDYRDKLNNFKVLTEVFK